MRKPVSFISLLCMAACANCYLICRAYPQSILLFVAVFIAANLLPSFSKKSFPNFRLRMCYHGNQCLRLFLISVAISAIYHIFAAFYSIPSRTSDFLLSILICILIEAAFFWNGMISLYCTSVQLGIRERVIGALCGMIPILNLIVLHRILKITTAEVDFETQKATLNAERKHLEICKTKYPILMVHGVFFRDFKFPNYWGRIPNELTQNGATVFYGNHQSALSVADSAAELSARIREIVNETGCEKVNIIAHSKGGLDCRYAVSHLGAAPYVASLTTINTPHRGCKFADYLLEKAPEALRQKVEDTYNSAFRKIGDANPDFMAAVTDLTSKSCAKLDADMQNPTGVYCSSVGSVLSRATGGKFPLSLTYHLVHLFDGANDGLVGVESFAWGDSYTLLKASGSRGISHGDMIDLNRENIPGFDVREFYVKLVENLKNQDF